MTAKWTGAVNCDLGFPHRVSIPADRCSDGNYRYSLLTTKYCQAHRAVLELDPRDPLPKGRIVEWQDDDWVEWGMDTRGKVF